MSFRKYNLQAIVFFFLEKIIFLRKTRTRQHRNRDIGICLPITGRKVVKGVFRKMRLFPAKHVYLRESRDWNDYEMRKRILIISRIHGKWDFDKIRISPV